MQTAVAVASRAVEAPVLSVQATAVAASWDGAHRWPNDDSVGSDADGAPVLETLPPGANLGITL